MMFTGQACSRCLMDESDTDITFDEAGECSHCKLFDEVTSKKWHPNADGEQMLERMVASVQKEGAGKEYDCVLGLSGGIDSSYLALKAKELGLRPLVVHVDAGWNSELAVHNIERIVNYCDFDLHTVVINWEEIKDLQLAYLRSGISNQDVVQDHAYFASLYHFSTKAGIRHVLNGGNIATESVFPKNWHHSAMDARNLLDIHAKHGTSKLSDYRTVGFLRYYAYYPYIKRMKVLRPLNLMPYDKDNALTSLVDTAGYTDYGKKHGESVFTRYFQNHHLVEKYGFDKRKIHLSSRILSEQITREEGLAELGLPLYDSTDLRLDTEYISQKLEISVEELKDFATPPGNSYTNYKNWDKQYAVLKRAQSSVSRLTGRHIAQYG